MNSVKPAGDASGTSSGWKLAGYAAVFVAVAVAWEATQYAIHKQRYGHARRNPSRRRKR